MSKGSSTPSVTTNQVQLPAWVDAAAQANIGQAQQVAAQPYVPYTGQQVAPITADQQAAFNYIGSQLGQAPQNIANATSGITGGNLTATTQSLLNPYLANVEDATTANMIRAGQQAQQGLASQAEGAGAYGGSRYGIQSGLLSSETQRNIGQAVSQIQSQGWNQAVQTALEQSKQIALQDTAQQQAALQSGQALMQVGGAEQSQQQAADTAAWQAWQQQQDYPLQQLAINESALTSTPYGTTSTSTQSLNKPSPIAAGASGALGGAVLGSALGASALGASMGLTGASGGGIGSALGLALALL